MKRSFYVYMTMNCRNTVIYIGITSDLGRRITEHKEGAIPGFTLKYNVDKLVYYEEYKYVNDAIGREKQLKRWRREKKLNLIKEVNPDLIERYPE